MEPLVSVIVPIYNAEKYLSECIESILGQTYRKIQLILVNDGSTDNSLQICHRYKEMDNRILVLDQPNSGVSAARNLGLKYAQGDYIGFVDSDDYVEENMYEVLVNKIAKEQTDLCAMTAYTISRLGMNKLGNIQRPIKGLEALRHLLLLRFPTSLWAYLYSRNMIKNYTLNNDIHFFEDFEFNFRVLLKARKVSICDQPLYNYRINETSINSQRINDKKMTCLNIYNLILDDIKKHLLTKQAAFFRAHCLISIVASISKSTMVEQKYYSTAQSHAKHMIKDVIASRFVPFAYKFVILSFACLPKFTARTIYYLKYNKIDLG